MCGIAQQSLNYIVTNNLTSSKLAPQIAAALEINPEWLILGQGKFEESKIYELPIIHSPYMLKKYLKNEIDDNAMEFTVINTNLGNAAFAYLIETTKLAICSADKQFNLDAKQYLAVRDSGAVICNDKSDNSYPIFEWRIRDVDF